MNELTIKAILPANPFYLGKTVIHSIPEWMIPFLAPEYFPIILQKWQKKRNFAAIAKNTGINIR